MLNSVQLSPELNSNFAICNIYPNREPKDFYEKKKRPTVNNLAAIKCSSPFNYNVIDEEKKIPKADKSSSFAFKPLWKIIKITLIRNSKMNETKIR